MSNQNNIKVEVVFALKDKQELITIILSNFSTVFDAIKKSKIQEKYPDFDFDSCAVGIWSSKFLQHMSQNQNLDIFLEF